MRNETGMVHGGGHGPASVLRSAWLIFTLHTTYLANAVLNAIKQIPGLKRILPDSLYQAKGLKIFANILAVLWDIVMMLFGPFLYCALLFSFVGSLKSGDGTALLLQSFLFTMVIGCLLNTDLFAVSKDKFYAIVLMRMSAKRYSLTTFLFELCRTWLGLSLALPAFSFFFSIPGTWLWLVAFGTIGAKLMTATLQLRGFKGRQKLQRTSGTRPLGTWTQGIRQNVKETGEDDMARSRSKKYSLTGLFVSALLLTAMLVLASAGIVIPVILSVSLYIVVFAAGLSCLPYLFKGSEALYLRRTKLALRALDWTIDAEAAVKIRQKATASQISEDQSVGSDRKGLEYLNDLFVKRHKKLLWNSTKWISLVSAAIFILLDIVSILLPTARPDMLRVVSGMFSYMLLAMYFIKRGTAITQAMFMNCDHSLLTYPFYKKPALILRLFRIRLREIMKINGVPGAIIGAGMVSWFALCGGAGDLLQCLVIFVSILCMSFFFSIHYLTLYYLLQPFNTDTQIKNGTYIVLTSLTYVVTYMLGAQLHIPIMLFGVSMIAFTAAYSLIASLLVYRFAPKTFRIHA